MPTPEEELKEIKERFAKLAAASTYFSASYRALLKAAREMLPPSRHEELRLLTNKYLPEELEDEEITLEDMDPALGAIISARLEERG